ncbi:MAG TPA: pilus assembly protein TadG-related protein [Bryobacteraceae bacterium]
MRPKRKKSEAGQVTIVVALALSIFLLGGLGLAIDGGQMYAQRQMAQAAADAAAEAGMMSIFNGSNASGTHQFTATAGTSIDPCGTSVATPCYYAGTYNGFNTANDSVKVDFGNGGSSWAPAGLSLSGDPTNLVRVTVSRQINTSFLRLLGPATATVRAQAIAAILSEVSPIPLIVTHPTLAGAFSFHGTPTVTINGGPQRAVQVNSDGSLPNSNPPPISPPNAYATRGTPGTVDLSHAGPNGNGADFAILGQPNTKPSSVSLGSGNWVPGASPFQDPLASVTPPSVPATTGGSGGTPSAAEGCITVTPSKPCHFYTPGLYTSSINVSNEVAVFKPGIYYMNGGSFSTAANGTMTMAVGFTDGSTGTNTGWTGNMLVYLTGPGSPAAIGTINVGANGSVNLMGSPSGSAYKGILFFVDRSAASRTHSLGGNADMTLVGTIYANTLSNLFPSTYQTIDLSGKGGNTTNLTGEIITGVLSLGGTGAITMNLSGTAVTVRQVALVN